MKKTLLGFLCLFAVMVSCDISMPQSIIIRGTPGVYLSLGNPFDALPEGSPRIEDLISSESIMEMMGEIGDLKIYDYRPMDLESDVQAYLIHYPIIEMDLVFGLGDVFNNSENIVIEIPELFTNSIAIPNFGYGICIKDDLSSLDNYEFMEYVTDQTNTSTHGLNCSCDPLITVDMSEMAKLLKEANGVFGIDIAEYDEHLMTNLMLKIPALGINAFTTGQEAENSDGETVLRFSNPGKDKFTPGTDMDDNELKIYVKIKNTCSGNVTPRILFDWDSAIIDTTGIGGLSGTNDIDLDLSGVLGDGIEFNKIEGYIFVDGIGNSAKITLLLGSNTIYGGVALNPHERPEFPNENKGTYNKGKITNHSVDSGPIPLHNILNSSGGGELFYDISIENYQVSAAAINAGNASAAVTADLVIILYLDLNISGETVTLQDDEGNLVDYMKLEMGIGDILENNGDIFGRTGDSDDIFDQLRDVKIFVNHGPDDITIFDPSELAILVTSGDQYAPDYQDYIIFDGGNKNFITITFNDLPDVFSPRFDILLKIDDGATEANLQIKQPEVDKPHKFDFTIAVEAVADLNITMDL